MLKALVIGCAIFTVALSLALCIAETAIDEDWADDWTDWPEIPRGEREE